MRIEQEHYNELSTHSKEIVLLEVGQGSVAVQYCKLRMCCLILLGNVNGCGILCLCLFEMSYMYNELLSLSCANHVSYIRRNNLQVGDGNC